MAGPSGPKMAELTLHVHDIDDVGKDYEFTLSPAWLTRELADCDLRPAGPEGHVDVHVQLSGRDALVNGRVRAEIVAPCSRCLGDVPCAVDTDLIALLAPTTDARGRALPADAEIELTDEDIVRGHYNGSQIVLDDLVRQQIILEVPMQPLCAGGCEVIPVPDHVRPPPEIFGAPPVDPRLAPLLKFKDKVSRNKE